MRRLVNLIEGSPERAVGWALLLLELLTSRVCGLFVRRPPGRHSKAYLAERAAPHCSAPRPSPRPHHRAGPSPYGPPTPWREEPRKRTREKVIDGAATALVRPYVLAAEERRRRAAEEELRRVQRQRRRELALAVMGQDAEPCPIHGVRVAS